MSSLVIARYHELLLKRGNRGRFLARLLDNVRAASRGLPVGRAFDLHGRVALELADESAWPELRDRMARIFGLANFSLARRLPLAPPDAGARPDLGPLADAVAALVAGRSFGSFRVVTRRADKRFPIPSPEISAEVGGALQERTGARVDLENAELTVVLEVLPGEVVYSAEKVAGAGGLPVGTAGEVVALLSGGIDSPVAAARMMRRGCRVHCVHFHSVPYLSRRSQEKARDLARRLAHFQLDVRLVLVPFGEVQRKIVGATTPPPRVVLYRRMMVRIAGELARRFGAEALVTGDSLGQVASQTLRNLAVVEEAAPLPLFRPLIGMDKNEVVDEARRLGTFDTSVEPDEDCCTLFTPRHPETRARIDAVRALEARLDPPALVAEALAGAEVERYRFPERIREPEKEELHAEAEGDRRTKRGR